MPTTVLEARSAVAVASRRGDAEAVLTARRDLAAAKIEQYVTRIVEQAPPLTPEQKSRLAALIKPVTA